MPATFQRAMTLILRGLTWKEVLAYLDDIIILGRDFDDSLKNLVKVLDKFREHKLKLKAEKCQLFQEEIIFLGKLCSRHGISPNPSSIAVVKNWPTPLSSKEVERFMGLANYHRAHIRTLLN